MAEASIAPSGDVGLGDRLARRGAHARCEVDLAGAAGGSLEAGVRLERRSQRSRLVLHVPADVAGRADGGQDGQADGAALQHPGRDTSHTLTAALRNGTRSKVAPRISLASAPRCVSRISW